MVVGKKGDTKAKASARVPRERPVYPKYPLYPKKTSERDSYKSTGRTAADEKG